MSAVLRADGGTGPASVNKADRAESRTNRAAAHGVDLSPAGATDTEGGKGETPFLPIQYR